MSRRRIILKREIIPDAKYASRLITRFVNGLFKRGKKSTAESILYKAFDIIAARTNTEPLEIFEKAIEQVKPVVEVKSRRVGGSTYQVPVDVRPERRNALSIRWIVASARSRSEKGMHEKLAGELMDAAQGRGAAVKKREDVHRMADANKAFAHYRW